MSRSGLRIAPPSDPVTITLDGKKVVAERGEPVAAALVATGKLAMARSPKFHRPRGPSCFSGACDGCLARVDGVPNVMTCLVPAREGLEVETQNHSGPGDFDVFRMTDWFFPDGMNHHELFAGVPGVQDVMQAFARRVAGLGQLPSKPAAPRNAERRTVDVLVVGAGPSGMSIALLLAALGKTVEVIDDKPAPGGSLTALGSSSAPFERVVKAFAEAIETRRIRFRGRTLAAGVYGPDTLVVGPEGASIVEARALVLACGAHDGAVAFEGNDLPGVMSARAGGVLLSHGVLPGRRIVVVVAEGGGPFGASFASSLESVSGVHVEVVHGEIVAARGRSRVSSVVVRDRANDGKNRTIEADALLVDSPRSPAYELAAQASAELRYTPAGFAVVAPEGRATDRMFAVGEVAGVPLDAAAIADDARRAAATIADSS